MNILHFLIFKIMNVIMNYGKYVFPLVKMILYSYLFFKFDDMNLSINFD